MRKLSLVAGVLLTLAVSATTMAATPAAATRTVAHRTPAVTTTTLTWKAAYAKAAISGSAVMSGTSTYTSDKVVARATGIKKGAAVVLRLFWKSGTHDHTFATTAVAATLTASGQFVRTWSLSSTQRAALRAAEAHKYAVYFRLVDGSTIATGLFK